MTELRKHLPDISRWVESIDGVEAILNHGVSIISSSAGVHQGDPLASLLFSLALNPLILQIAREVPNLTQNAWFLDDGVLGGTKADLQSAVDIIKQKGPDMGHYHSIDKSQI